MENARKERYGRDINESLRVLAEMLTTSGGKTRTYLYLLDSEKQRLKVKYEYGMSGMPDYDLEFETNKGCVGNVWTFKELYCFSLNGRRFRQLQKRFSFTPGQLRAIRQSSVKSACFLPVYNPATELEEDVIAVLGIDSTNPIAVSGLGNSATHEKIAEQAYTIGRFLVDGKLIWVELTAKIL